jgi:nucleoside recognition membrane protein YjiH
VKDLNLERMLENLENEATDEFEQLLSVGGKYFETADLLYLKGRWRERYLMFLKLHRLLIAVAAASPVLLLLGTALAFLKVHYPAFVLIALAPVAFCVFLVGSFLLKREFRSKGHLEHIGLLLAQEMNERVQARRIKR